MEGGQGQAVAGRWLPGAERTTRQAPNTQEEALGSRVQEGRVA